MIENDLNSVLLEGVEEIEPTQDAGYVWFNVCTKRVVKNQRQTIDTTIMVPGNETLGDRCLADIWPGRRVRVVGRLDELRTGIVVRAEHVEFRPGERPIKVEAQDENSLLVPEA